MPTRLELQNWSLDRGMSRPHRIMFGEWRSAANTDATHSIRRLRTGDPNRWDWEEPCRTKIGKGCLRSVALWRTAGERVRPQRSTCTVIETVSIVFNSTSKLILRIG